MWLVACLPPLCLMGACQAALAWLGLAAVCCACCLSYPGSLTGRQASSLVVCWPAHLQVSGDALCLAGAMHVLPPIVLQITPEHVQAILRDVESSEDVESYAPSTTSYPKAIQAAARVGWTLQPLSLHPATQSSRRVRMFDRDCAVANLQSSERSV